MTDVASLVVEADSRQIKSLNRDLDGMVTSGSKAEKSAGKLTSQFKQMAIGAAAIGASFAILVKTIDAHRKYTSAMSELSAITGAVGKDLEFYNQQAKQIGETTTLSASQAAEAFKLIASAKPDLLESKEALAAVTREAVTLAEASGLSMPEAAKALGSSLNQFSEDADQASRYINILAAGAKFGASEINDTSMALKVAGTVASGVGLSFEETNAAIQAMASVSIKGSEAGTGLRGVLLKLSTQTRSEFNPEIVGLSTALKNLAGANLSTTEKTKLFGLESITAASALILQAGTIDELTEKLTGTDTAYEQASVRVNNLDGDIKKLDSAYESVALTMGEKFDPALRSIVQLITWLSKPIKVAIIEFTDLGDLLGAVVAAAERALHLDFSGMNAIMEARKAQRKSVDETIKAIWKEEDAHKENKDAITKEAEAIEKKRKADVNAAKLAKQKLALIREEILARKESVDEIGKLIDVLDPAGVLTREYAHNWELIDKAISSGDMGTKQANEMKAALVDLLQNGLSPAKKEFEEIGDTASNSLSMVVAGFSSLQSVFSEGSKGLKLMKVATDVANVALATNAVLNQGAGDPYTAFARMAAMASAVAGLGVSIGGFTGGSDGSNSSEQRQASQGTGSVLGDAASKSESILRAVETTSEASEKIVSINRGMLDELKGLRSSISGVVTLTARAAGNTNIASPETGDNIFDGTGRKLFDVATLGMGDEILDVIFLGLGDEISSLIGGKSRKIDEGIRVMGGNIQDLVESGIVDAYATFKVKKNIFDDYDIEEKFQGMGDDVTRQFGLIFSGIVDSVSEGAASIGVSGVDIQKALDEFFINTTKISLDGLGTEDQKAELEAVFGKIFDDLAIAVIPSLVDLQRAGEGTGETLARVATDLQVMENATEKLGFTVSSIGVTETAKAAENLIELAGGIEKFASSISGFVDKFASEEYKIKSNADEFEKSLSQVGLSIPNARDGFWELMQAQDASTESGAAAIATLLRVQDVADKYYSNLEEAARIAEEASSVIGDVGDSFSRTAEDVPSVIEDTGQAFTDLINILDQAISESVQVSDTALNKLRDSVRIEKSEMTSAYNDLVSLKSSSLNNEINAIKFASDENIKAIKQQESARLKANQMVTNAARAGLSDISKEISGIQSAIKKLSGAGGSQLDQQKKAIEFLSRAISSGNLSGVGAAADVASGISESQFGSSSEYARQVGLTKNLLLRIEESGLGQKSVAEQTIERMSNQTSVIRAQSAREIEISKELANEAILEAEKRHDDEVKVATEFYESEIARLDGIVLYAEEHVGILRGIDVRVLSVEEAIHQMTNVYLNEASARRRKETAETLGPNGISSGLVDEIRGLRTDVNNGNRAIAKNTLKTAKVLDQFDGDGMPSDRGF